MSAKKMDRKQRRIRRKPRVRAKVTGTASRPRLSVFRSARHVYAQVIDDGSGTTIAAASDLMIPAKDLKKTTTGDRSAKRNVAFAVGKMVAEAAQKKGVESVVFDRNGFAYTGRVAALADGAREGGLKF